jgi:hypothetical protein
MGILLPAELGSAAMISDLQRMVVLPIALVAFLFAASTQGGMVWRGSKPNLITLAFR